MDKFVNTVKAAQDPVLTSCERPHSFFAETVERHASDERAKRALHRICNLMRKMGACAEVIEQLAPCEESRQVQEQIQDAWGCECQASMKRMTFLSRNPGAVAALETEVCAEDILGSIVLAEWKADGKRSEHVYEAIIRPPVLLNNYIHSYASLPVRCADKLHSIRGTYFCQQNGISGVCAHATIRMLLNTSLGMMTSKVTDTAVNKILGLNSGTSQAGLTAKQVGDVFRAYGLSYQAVPVGAADVDYVSFLLSLLESNSPGAIAFEIEGQHECHILPVMGHTFNSDLWFHEANYAYHPIGQTRYHPHSNWVPCFIVHDDNFGMYYCMAVDSLLGDSGLGGTAQGLKAFHAFGFLPQGVERTGRNVTDMASLLLRAIVEHMHEVLDPPPQNVWLHRLLDVCRSKVSAPVFRTLLVSRARYAAHLEQMLDWQFGALTGTDVQRLVRGLPDQFWMCEVSITDLYTTNKRKLGEILYDATQKPDAGDCAKGFLRCRLPTLSVLQDFRFSPNGLNGHVPLCPTAAIPPHEW